MAALRAVKPGEVAESKPPLTLLQAIESGSRLEIELAQRRDIVKKLADSAGPAAAALHRQLSITNDKIETLEAREQQQEGAKNAAVSDEAFDAEAI